MIINFLISGVIRPNEKCFLFILEHLKNQFSEFEVKVFVSTWEHDNINFIKVKLIFLIIYQNLMKNFYLKI